MRGRRLRWAVAGTLLAALVVTVAAATSAPGTVRVTVLDGALRPATARVALGGTVTWANAGRRTHRITSDTRAWATFSLKPRAQKSIRFGRAGSFPYRADGRVRGVVLVVAGGAGGGGGGSGGGRGTTPASRCCFAVTVTVSAKAVTTWYQKSPVDGTGTITETWTWEALNVEGYEENGKRWHVSEFLPNVLSDVDFTAKVRLEYSVGGTLVVNPDRPDQDSIGCGVTFLTNPRFAPAHTDVLSLEGPVPDGGKGHGSSGESSLELRQKGRCTLESNGREVEAQTMHHSFAEDEAGGFMKLPGTPYDWPVVAPAGASGVLRAGRSLNWAFTYHNAHPGSKEKAGHATAFTLKGRVELRYFPPSRLGEELAKLRRL